MVLKTLTLLPCCHVATVVIKSLKETLVGVLWFIFYVLYVFSSLLMISVGLSLIGIGF